MSWDYKNDPSNPDAIPAYNDNILKFWNWFDTVWSCSDWMTWHKAMLSKYGKNVSNARFMKYWDDLATGSSAIDCRTFNTSFRDYMRKVGLLDELYNGLGFVAKPLGTVGDVATGIGNSVSNVAKTSEKLSNVLKTLVPILLVIAVIFLIIYISKKYGISKQLNKV